MKKDISRILIKYYASMVLFLTVSFVSWYFICQRVQSGFVLILFFAMFYVAYALIRVPLFELLYRPVWNDLDAAKFHQLVNHKLFPFLRFQFRFPTAYFLGDYDTAASVSALELQHSRKLSHTLIYLSYQVRVHFETRHFDRLRETVDRFFALKEQHGKKHKKLFASYSEFDYFKAFLAKDYDGCFAALDKEKETVLAKRKRLRPIDHVLFLAYAAVAHYEAGRHEEAKKLFEEVLAVAPKLDNVVKLSRTYLAAIEQQDESILAPIKLKEDAAREKKWTAQHKKIARLQTFLRILIVVIVIFLVANVALIEYARYRIALEEKPLRAAIEEYYDEYEILDTYWVEDPYKSEAKRS